MVHNKDFSEWNKIHTHILQLENEGLVTRTFRRLDPERQREILLAILSEAASKGPTQVNIKSVAERANAAVGTLYTYFSNREGMLEFAVEMVTRFILEEMESYRPFLASLPLRQGLQVYLTGGVEWSQIFASFVQLFARAAYQGDPNLQERLVRPIADLLRNIIQEMLDQAVQRGEVRADIDTEATARVLHALTIAIGDSQLLPYLNTYFQVMDDQISIERTMEAMLAMVMQGITNEF
jgi:AcrR family transcriptional regulator